MRITFFFVVFICKMCFQRWSICEFSISWKISLFRTELPTPAIFSPLDEYWLIIYVYFFAISFFRRFLRQRRCRICFHLSDISDTKTQQIPREKKANKENVSWKITFFLELILFSLLRCILFLPPSLPPLPPLQQDSFRDSLNESIFDLIFFFLRFLFCF